MKFTILNKSEESAAGMMPRSYRRLVSHPERRKSANCLSNGAKPSLVAGVARDAMLALDYRTLAESEQRQKAAFEQGSQVTLPSVLGKMMPDSFGNQIGSKETGLDDRSAALAYELIWPGEPFFHKLCHHGPSN